MTAREDGRARGLVVEALSSALERGGSGLENAPTLLRRLLEEESWRSFVTQRGELVEYQRFADFVVTPPLKGLGATVGLVQRVVSDDPVAVDLLDLALTGKQGARTDLVDNINEVARPDGTSRAASLRRLRKDAPDLHAAVLAGRLSAHAAMVKGGFRHRTISVPADDPAAAARSLKKNLSPDDLAALTRLLSEAG